MDIKESTVFNNSVRHPWEVARLQISFDLIASIPFSKKEITVLDIGSGDLFVISNISKKLNFDCYAVDTALTPELISQYQNQNEITSVKIFNNWNQLDENITDPIDLVLLMDVIEHIEDAPAFLKQILSKSYINTNTYFFITVPSYQNLFSSHDLLLGHFRRYNIRLLKEHIEIAGMKSVESGYFFLSLTVARFIQFILEKINGGSDDLKTITSAWNKSAFTTTVLKNFLLADYKISRLFKFLGINLPGLSTYVICRKSAS